MSIIRSGLARPVLLRCIQSLQAGGADFIEGQHYELLLDMAVMYVIKASNGQEIVVPKDSFELIKD